MRKLLIFDCDGTLINTIVDVALSFNAALNECGFSEHPIKAYDGFVGGNLETVVSRMLSEKDRTTENIDRVKTAYRRIYSSSDKENTRPYDGMVEMLLRLKEKGYILAVNTNKGQKLTDELLDKLELTSLFDSVVGYEESRPSKPDPYGVKLICSQCGAELEDAVYIGDGRSDILTAVNAGIPCILVTWGQTTDEDKQDERVAHRVDRMDQLEQVIIDCYG